MGVIFRTSGSEGMGAYMHIRRFPPTTGSLGDETHLTVFVKAFFLIATHLTMSAAKSQLAIQQRHPGFLGVFFIQKNESFVIDKAGPL